MILTIMKSIKDTRKLVNIVGMEVLLYMARAEIQLVWYYNHMRRVTMVEISIC